MNTNTMPLEAETRVLIDRSLENLGWKLNGKDQNVYYEQPRSDKSFLRFLRAFFGDKLIAF